MKNWRLLVWGIVAAVLLVAIGVVAASGHRGLSSSESDFPLAPVERGELDLKVYTTGELKANLSKTLTAPPIGGGSLKITKLLRTETPVKTGDLVIEFDPSEQRYKLEQSHSELLEAEQDMIKANADAAVQTAKDKVDLLKARFAVRQAQLEVQKNELVSGIDAKKNQLSLEQANRALAELEHDIQSHGITGKTGIDLAREKMHKAQLSMDQAQQNIEKMRVLSPIDGLVAIQKNFEANEFMFRGASVPDYHEGDQAQPGSAIAQVIDSHDMEITAKVSELDRSNIASGQPVEVEFDALPGRIFHGNVKSAGAMVQRSLFLWDMGSGSQYDVSLQISDPDPLLLPGLTAQIVILGGKKPNTLYIPRQALFLKDGKQTVFLKKSGGFQQRPVKVDFENESRAAIEGLKAGDEVALIDPTAPRKAASSGSSPAPGGGMR